MAQIDEYQDERMSKIEKAIDRLACEMALLRQQVDSELAMLRQHVDNNLSAMRQHADHNLAAISNT